MKTTQMATAAQNAEVKTTPKLRQSVNPKDGKLCHYLIDYHTRKYLTIDGFGVCVRNWKKFEEEYADVIFSQTQDAFGDAVKVSWNSCENEAYEGENNFEMVLDSQNSNLMTIPRDAFDEVYDVEATYSQYYMHTNADISVPSLREARILDEARSKHKPFIRLDEHPDEEYPADVLEVVKKIRAFHNK